MGICCARTEGLDLNNIDDYLAYFSKKETTIFVKVDSVKKSGELNLSRDMYSDELAKTIIKTNLIIILEKIDAETKKEGEPSQKFMSFLAESRRRLNKLMDKDYQYDEAKEFSDFVANAVLLDLEKRQISYSKVVK